MDVTVAQAEAYKYMQQTYKDMNVAFGPANILTYLENSLIKDYAKSKISIAVDL